MTPARIVKHGDVYGVFLPNRELPIMCVDGDDASNVVRLWERIETLEKALEPFSHVRTNTEFYLVSASLRMTDFVNASDALHPQKA